MRCLKRNKTEFAYSNYLGKELIEVDGVKTGEYKLNYSDPITIKGYISRATGNNATDLFGIDVNYDKSITIDNPSLNISEDSVLWVDERDTTKPYDYVVKRISKSLNYLTIAIKKVEVKNG